MKTEINSMVQKLNVIDQKIKEIKRMQRYMCNPIFIELLGTPKSGKTTLKNYLSNLFENNDINYFARQETAEYNPVEKTSNGYNLWMVLELLKNVDEDLSKADGKIIIYDRGLLDRMAWMEYDVQNEKMFKEDKEIILKAYQIMPISDYKPISKVYITSPQLSIKRKGKSGKFVNEDSIRRYNQILKNQISTIQKRSLHSDITYTDEYEGDIKNFIIDSTFSIVNEIYREIQRMIQKELVNEKRKNSEIIKSCN